MSRDGPLARPPKRPKSNDVGNNDKMDKSVKARDPFPSKCTGGELNAQPATRKHNYYLKSSSAPFAVSSVKRSSSFVEGLKVWFCYDRKMSSWFFFYFY